MIEQASHSNRRTIVDYLHSPGQVDDKAQEENRLMAGTAPRDIVIGYQMREIKRENTNEREAVKGQVSPSCIRDGVTER